MHSRLLVAGALVAIVLGMAWFGFGAAPASAQSPGLQFSIAIPGLPNCDTKSGDATCSLAPGTTFVIDVSLDSPPDESPRYSGLDISLRFSGVTRQGEPRMQAWPACAISAVGPARSDGLLFGCSAGLPPGTASSYTGPIATVTFSCSQSGSVSLDHGNAGTDLSDSGGNLYTEGSGATDKLTINCQAGGAQPTPPTPVPVRDTPTFPPSDNGPPPTAAEPSSTPARSTGTPAMTATPSPTPGRGKKDNGGGGVNGGLIAIIVIAAVAGTGGLGFLGWRYLQARRGAGGGT